MQMAVVHRGGFGTDREMSMEANTSRSPEMSVSVSLEQELDSYKEKVDHMKMLVKQYSQELQSYKIRKEGVETVSKLLQEARQEIAVSQKKSKTQDVAIRNLQSRLTSNGLSGNIIMQEGDMFIPGTSNQLLDNLTRENSRLRTLLRGASVDPEDISALQQELRRKNETIEDYKRTGEDLETRVRQLQDLMGSSENEKDQTISSLQTTIRKMKEEFQTRDVLCHSLAEETSNLRQQLHDVAVTCQQMALRLERSEKASRALEPKHLASNLKSSEFSIEAKEKLLVEKRELQRKLDEVVIMNKRWQEYETQREAYVKQLQAASRALQDQLATSQANQLSLERSRMINQALDEAQRRLALTEEGKRGLETELNASNQMLIQQATEVERLKHDLDLAHQGGAPTHRSDVEILDALKAQIQICTEDFESERRDREHAQSKVSSLEAELQKVKMERDRLVQAAIPRSELRYEERPLYQNQDFYNNFNVPNTYQNATFFQNELAPRGGQDMFEYNVADGIIQVDAPPPSVDNKPEDLEETEVADRVSDHLSDTPLLDDAPLLSDDRDIEDNEETTYLHGSNVRERSQTEKSILTCPNCSKEFTSDKHGELLEHLELCCD